MKRQKRPGGAAAPESAEENFGTLVASLTRRRGVTFGGQGFGSSALKVNGRIFAMLSSKGQFVVKLPAARARELSQSGTATPFEPRPGKPMKEWVVVPTALATLWKALAEEAQRFVAEAADR